MNPPKKANTLGISGLGALPFHRNTANRGPPVGPPRREPSPCPCHVAEAGDGRGMDLDLPLGLPGDRADGPRFGWTSWAGFNGSTVCNVVERMVGPNLMFDDGSIL